MFSHVWSPNIFRLTEALRKPQMTKGSKFSIHAVSSRFSVAYLLNIPEYGDPSIDVSDETEFALCWELRPTMRFKKIQS